jgi:SRSO17 transposase
VSVKTLALRLPKHAWRTITWREGSAEKLTSRSARVRVRTAPSKGARELGAAGRPEEALLIEWPPGEAAPTKYWLSNLLAKTKFRDLVDITKMRWRIERDYQELKQEIGLDHYEGRGWRGFHHHATLWPADSRQPGRNFRDAVRLIRSATAQQQASLSPIMPASVDQQSMCGIVFQARRDISGPPQQAG